MTAPGVWDNASKAQELVDDMRRLTREIKPLKELQSAADDIGVLVEFAAEDKTGASTRELTEAVEGTTAKVAAAAKARRVSASAIDG